MDIVHAHSKKIRRLIHVLITGLKAAQVHTKLDLVGDCSNELLSNPHIQLIASQEEPTPETPHPDQGGERISEGYLRRMRWNVSGDFDKYITPTR